MTLPLGGLRSARVPDPDRLARLARPRSIVLVGSTCTGKTTLAAAIRCSPASTRGLVDVPLRYITRPARDGDDGLESVHVSPDELAARVVGGTIAIAWRREIEPGRFVSYGFAAPRAGAFPVYSANNAIFAPTADLRPAGAFADALLVGVVAPDPLRAERLRRQSPDLWARPGEVAHRLADHAAGIEAHVHVVIDNHGALEAVAPIELVELVERARAVT